MVDLSTYDTDKVAAGYFTMYESWLARFVPEPIVLLELGVLGGESLRLWRDYFPKGIIVGVDVNPVTIRGAADRITVYQGRQDDTALLTQIAATHAPEGFDVIIDDASHEAAATRAAFWHLFNRHLKSGGLYVIEDWGTGYWADWPDGERPGWRARRTPHLSGMVGFVKELVDEVGASDLTRGARGKPAGRRSYFREMTLAHGLCAVTKA